MKAFTNLNPRDLPEAVAMLQRARERAWHQQRAAEGGSAVEF